MPQITVHDGDRRYAEPFYSPGTWFRHTPTGQEYILVAPSAYSVALISGQTGRAHGQACPATGCLFDSSGLLGAPLSLVVGHEWREYEMIPGRRS